MKKILFLLAILITTNLYSQVDSVDVESCLRGGLRDPLVVQLLPENFTPFAGSTTVRSNSNIDPHLKKENSCGFPSNSQSSCYLPNHVDDMVM